MTPDPTDPDIVPATDRGDCGSSFLYTPVGLGDDSPDALFDWPWTDPPDTLDTGSAE